MNYNSPGGYDEKLEFSIRAIIADNLNLYDIKICVSATIAFITF
jgi:hypothetical protein